MNKRVKKALYLSLLMTGLSIKKSDAYTVEASGISKYVEDTNVYSNFKDLNVSNLFAGIAKEPQNYLNYLASLEEDNKYQELSIISNNNYKERSDIEENPIDNNYKISKEASCVEAISKEKTDKSSEIYHDENLEAQTRSWEERNCEFSVYYDSFPCDVEFQNHIKSVASKYEVPFEVLMIILDQETNGYWNANGVISKTNDYGLAQINKCNLQFIYDSIGITKNQVLNDPYKAVEAEAFIVRYCFDNMGYDQYNFDYRNAFGCYNGWLKWEEKEPCRKYADRCMERLSEHFDINDRYIGNKMVKK